MASTTVRPLSALSPSNGDAILGLLSGLIDSSGRQQAAKRLAAYVGGTDLLIFVMDAEIGRPLPAPGFPQTLSRSHLWRDLQVRTARDGSASGRVDHLDGSGETDALVIAIADGSQLAVLGTTAVTDTLRRLCLLLPLLCAAFRAERAAHTADASAVLARRSAVEAQRLAASLDQARSRVETLAVENARLYHQAQTSLQIRDEFLSVASHELKTPLTSMTGFVQLLLRRIDREPDMDRDHLRRSLESVLNQAWRLVHLAEQLLDSTRLETGDFRLQPRQVDLADLIETIVRDLPGPRRDRVRLHIPGPASAWVDPVRIEQVVVNLLENALKYAPDPSPVELSVMGDSMPGATISVRDYGPGIPPEHHARVFDRYYQVQPGSSLGGQIGLGLGLFISKRIVVQHGGSIHLEAPPDGGTRFVVSLPAAPTDPLPA